MGDPSPVGKGKDKSLPPVPSPLGRGQNRSECDGTGVGFWQGEVPMRIGLPPLALFCPVCYNASANISLHLSMEAHPMAFTTATLVDGLRHSRRHFLKHADGLTPEQWDWKPYPECKSAREALAHLVTDDRAALQSLQTGEEPDYEAHAVTECDIDALRVLLAQSHDALCAYLETHYAAAPLDTAICIWGAHQPAGSGIPYLSSEDFYHAGQIAFIRQATDPAWNYYSAIYGE